MDGAGNVMEWVEDWYAERYYEEAPDKNPPSPDHGVFRVLRGGGYRPRDGYPHYQPKQMVPDFRDETIGFRCAFPVKSRNKLRGTPAAKIYRKSK